MGNNWSHGFNSGCLAAFGFALTALDDSTYICDETEEEVSFGGLDTAMDEFPQLVVKQRRQLALDDVSHYFFLNNKAGIWIG